MEVHCTALMGFSSNETLESSIYLGELAALGIINAKITTKNVFDITRKM